MFKMPNGRNKPLAADCAVDFEAKIRHYQDLNIQIEKKTCAVFESVSKLNSVNSGHPENESLDISVYENHHDTDKNSKSPDRTVTPVRCETRSKSAVIKNQIIVDLNQRLRDIQNELETSTLHQKKLEEERDQQKQELVNLRENMKKMKSALHSKQLLNDAHKKEIAMVMEKLKIEEQSRKSLQKDIEKLTKQLSITTAEKEKLVEKLEHSKTDLLLVKQHKIDDYPNNRVPIMLKCIRKQAFLIENLLKQISCLEEIKK